MIIQMFSVYDEKTELFAQPFPSGTQESALRSFGDALVDSGSLLFKHPEDFSLYHVGSFDDNTGVFEQFSSATLLKGPYRAPK